MSQGRCRYCKQTPIIEISATTDGLQPAAVPAARFAVTAHTSGAPVTLITGTAPRRASRFSSPQSRAAEGARPATAPARSCKQHLSFGLKALSSRSLASAHRSRGSCNNNSVPAQVWVIEPLARQLGPAVASCKQQPAGVGAASAG
jgi:hypothetical protein